MSDIAKCNGKGCDKKDSCFRYLATASEYQSYIMIQDVTKCGHYWHVDSNTLERTQKEWDD